MLYSCNGDLVYASQQLNIELQKNVQSTTQHNQFNQSSISQNTNNSYNQHLLSLANPTGNNVSNNLPDMKSYQSAIMSTLNGQSSASASPSSYSQYHQHFTNQTNNNCNSPQLEQFTNSFGQSCSSALMNKNSAFSPMLTGNVSTNNGLVSGVHNQDQTVLSPFAAYSRIHQAMATHGTNNGNFKDFLFYFLKFPKTNIIKKLI